MKFLCKKYFILYCGIFFVGFLSFIQHGNAASDEIKSIFVQSDEYICGGDVCTTRAIGFGERATSVVLEWKDDSSNSFVRFFDGDRWLQWVLLSGENDAPDHENNNVYNRLFFLKDARAFQIKSRTPIQGMRALYFTIEKDTYRKRAYHATITDSISLSPSIIPRSEWLSNSIELPEDNREKAWKTEYDTVKKIIVHHTATTVKDSDENGIIDTNDYRDAIRAIYNYHTRGRKWGDIGYNFIIDPIGGIWEGRYGGDGSVAGHAFRDKACTKFGMNNATFNKGTIGIALLGTYSQQSISFEAAESLANLIAQKAWDFQFEPAGSSFLVDKVYQNVLAHRDIDCTDCPGDSVVVSLEAIIANAQVKYEALLQANPIAYRTQFIDLQPSEIEMKHGEEKEIVVRVRNTGTSTWRNYGDDAVQLAFDSVKQHLASINSFHIAIAAESAENPIQPYLISSKLLTPNVGPGEIGTFSFFLRDVGEELIQHKKFVILVGARGWIPQSEFAIRVMNTGLEYAGILEKGSPQNELLDELGTPVTLSFVNKGMSLWKQGDIRLALQQVDQSVPFINDRSWKHEEGRFSFLEKTVLPGERATFRFPVHGKTLGDLWILPLLLHGTEKVSGSDYDPLIFTIKPAYAVELVAFDFPKEALIGEKKQASVTIKNSGGKLWKRAGLSIYGAKKKQAVFRHSSWLTGTLVDQAHDVRPRDIITYIFNIQAPRKTGTFYSDIAFEYQKSPFYIKKDGEYTTSIPYSLVVKEEKKKNISKGKKRPVKKGVLRKKQ